MHLNQTTQNQINRKDPIMPNLVAMLYLCEKRMVKGGCGTRTSLRTQPPCSMNDLVWKLHPSTSSERSNPHIKKYKILSVRLKQLMKSTTTFHGIRHGNPWKRTDGLHSHEHTESCSLYDMADEGYLSIITHSLS